jgi:hypothetical protein
VDHTSSRNLGNTKEVFDHTASTQAIASSDIQSAGRRPAGIYLLHDSRGKHYVGSRADRRRVCVTSIASSLLYEQSPRSLEDKVSSSSEAIIYSTSNCSQTLTLL